ncbi:glycosyltransferase family 25 protein [Labedaea rhizosphaerae]|uniref:glycosyltransferase family 25 protein n=1 Tax=Labedaea rhizosphaerae TaxID=598644 RepID=UPI002441293B|nr:glycosyltransferase family 25 protein [Labedaea rhizosphaerae]
MVNLPRRPDRRAWIARSLPADLPVTYTCDWRGPFDGRELTAADLGARGYKLFPWQIDSSNPWWNRPLKYGEIGCTLAHLACWQDSVHNGQEWFTVILEDDAVLPSTFLDDLLVGIDLVARHQDFDLLYLGRVPLQPERERQLVTGFVVPAYSHCTFGYLLTRRGLDRILATDPASALAPVDEVLPALYIDHPRADFRARFPKCLAAAAFDPPLVGQRPKDEAGSDTEDSDFVES